MRNVIACLILSGAVVVNAQEFTSAQANLAKENYKKAVWQASTTYKTALESALRQAQSGKDGDEVDRIKEAIAEISDNQALAESYPDSVLARLAWKTVRLPEAEIGKVAKGDKILIKYVKGTIFAGGVPAQSPDTSDKVKCVLMGKLDRNGSYVPLMPIPMGTKEKPCEYTFDSAYASVKLMTSRTTSDNGGDASYKVAVIKTK